MVAVVVCSGSTDFRGNCAGFFVVADGDVATAAAAPDAAADDCGGSRGEESPPSAATATAAAAANRGKKWWDDGELLEIVEDDCCCSRVRGGLGNFTTNLNLCVSLSAISLSTRYPLPPTRPTPSRRPAPVPHPASANPNNPPFPIQRSRALRRPRGLACLGLATTTCEMDE